MQLSPRERDVYEFASRGFTTKYIARRLVLSPRTVDVHIRHIYEKTGMHCRDELIEHRENSQGDARNERRVPVGSVS